MYSFRNKFREDFWRKKISVEKSIRFSKSTREKLIKLNLSVEKKILSVLKWLKNFEKKNCLLAGKIFCYKKDALLKGSEKNFEKKLSLLAGKLSLEKKSLRFWMVSGFLVKNILSLLAGKNRAVCKRFLPIKSQSLCLISNQTLFKSAEFFFLRGNPT